MLSCWYWPLKNVGSLYHPSLGVGVRSHVWWGAETMWEPCCSRPRSRTFLWLPATPPLRNFCSLVFSWEEQSLLLHNGKLKKGTAFQAWGIASVTAGRWKGCGFAGNWMSWCPWRARQIGRKEEHHKEGLKFGIFPGISWASPGMLSLVWGMGRYLKFGDQGETWHDQIKQ